MTTCPHCGKEIAAAGDAAVRFCPYCGRSLQAVRPETPSDLERRVSAEKKPQKKYKLIQEALAANPNDFEANRALLYHGRLHEAMTRRGLDFSAIKCHLMSVFDNPSQYATEVLDAKYEELLRGPQLLRTMALAEDGEAFFAAYIGDMATLYINLFLRGDTRNNSLAFGFGRSHESTAKRCAEPVRAMLAEISRTERLTAPERALLLGAVREGFVQIFPGHGGLLAG